MRFLVADFDKSKSRGALMSPVPTSACHTIILLNSILIFHIIWGSFLATCRTSYVIEFVVAWKERIIATARNVCVLCVPRMRWAIYLYSIRERRTIYFLSAEEERHKWRKEFMKFRHCQAFQSILFQLWRKFLRRKHQSIRWPTFLSFHSMAFTFIIYGPWCLTKFQCARDTIWFILATRRCIKCTFAYIDVPLATCKKKSAEYRS